MSPTTLLSRIGYKNQKKMQTKALNTDVLNNSTPTVPDTKPALQLLSSSLPAQILSSDFNQDQGHPAPPAVPPRSILQSPSSPDLSRSSLSQGTGEVSLPGAPSLHTHSSKFPIEREVIVKSSNGKQCKIPNLSDYMRRAKTSVAPDAPPKQVAWTHSVNKGDGENASGPVQGIAAHQIYKAQPMSVMNSTKESEPSPIRPSNSLDFGPATSTPEDGSRGLSQRTYQSLKDMISSRFTKQNGAPVSPNLDNTLSPQSQLRQHGVYIGTPQSSNQQPPQLELRRMRMPLQQQRGFDQQPRIHFQPPNQQILNTPQMPYKYHHPLSGQQPSTGGPAQCTSYQSVSETQTFWKPYDEEEGLFRNQQTEEVALGGCPTGNTSPSEGLGTSHNQECPPADSYSSCDQRFKQNCRPPMNQQQQYRIGPSQPLNQNAGRSSGVPLYQTSQNHNDYTSHPSQFSQSPVIVHAPQDGHSKDDKQSGHVKSVELIHREGPQGAAVLAGPSIKEDEDDGLMKAGLQSDSGRGSTVYSSAKTSNEDTTPPLGETSEWSERVENELRQILNGPVNGVTAGAGTLNGGGGLTSASGANLGSSESFSSVSPPLPPLSPHSSDDTYQRPRNGGYGIKGGSNALWSARTKERKKAHKHSKSSNNLLCGGLEIDSMVDDNNTSEDEDYTDTRAIRKQLEGLETMYSQVLKLLGVRKHNLPRYEASDPRINKRRTCGSVSSVPSSVSSRPLRATDRRGRAGKVRDVRGVNKRFQRLESHVVTLARSVAHLSSEMRTQHIMMQEMEMMRGELAALRIQSNMQQQAAHQVSMQQATMLGGPSGGSGGNAGLNSSKQINSTPEKVKRLTKFFGDEPPLLRLFLRRLGYEKYASLFEKERIGLLELPFMSEERLVKLGIPLGPRIRIMQQAHLANPNTLCVL